MHSYLTIIGNYYGLVSIYDQGNDSDNTKNIILQFINEIKVNYSDILSRNSKILKYFNVIKNYYIMLQNPIIKRILSRS